MKQLIALMVLLLSLAACQDQPIQHIVYEGTAKEAILHNILTRRAIKKYTAQQVSKEQIDTIMKSAIFAPSAINKQPWEMRVVQNPNILKEINQRFKQFAEGQDLQGSAAEFRRPDFSAFHHAPTLIVIATDTANPSAKLDAGLALQNILLSAHAIGLATCPLGTLVTSMNQPENADVLKLLNIPEGYEVTINVALGYPAETRKAPIRYTEKVKIIE